MLNNSTHSQLYGNDIVQLEKNKCLFCTQGMQGEDVDFSSTDDLESRYSYQLVTSDGTVVRCLSKGESSNNIRYRFDGLLKYLNV